MTPHCAAGDSVDCAEADCNFCNFCFERDAEERGADEGGSRTGSAEPMMTRGMATSAERRVN